MSIRTTITLPECGLGEPACTIESFGKRYDPTDKIVSESGRPSREVKATLKEKTGVRHLIGLHLPRLAEYFEHLRGARDALQRQDFPLALAKLARVAKNLGGDAKADSFAYRHRAGFSNPTTQKPLREMAEQVLSAELEKLTRRTDSLLEIRYNYVDLEQVMQTPLFDRERAAPVERFASPARIAESQAARERVLNLAMPLLLERAEKSLQDPDSSVQEWGMLVDQLKFCRFQASDLPSYSPSSDLARAARLASDLRARIAAETEIVR